MTDCLHVEPEELCADNICRNSISAGDKWPKRFNGARLET
jgi:hypothetical protein